MEQPGRDGYAVCGLGEAIAVTRSGTDRFEGAAADCRRIGARTLEDDQAADPGRPPGAGPVFLGGFAFAAARRRHARVVGLRPGAAGAARDLDRPQGRPGAPDGDRGRGPAPWGGAPRPWSGRAAGWRTWSRRPCRCWTPARPLARGWPAPPRPSHYEDAVRRAVERIRCGSDEQGRAGPRGARADRARDRPGARPGRAPGRLSRLLLLLRRRPRGHLRGRKPGAAGAPRRRAGPDRGAGRHNAPQRRPRGGRPPGRAAAPEPEEPVGAGHRGAPHPAHAGPGQRVGRGGRRAGADQGAERPAPGHAHPGPALGPRPRGGAGRPAAPHARGRGRARTTWPSP